MAIITPSSIISEIRGSIGDKTFSRNKYRSYVKARVAPTDTQSSYKTFARLCMSNAIAAWQAFTDQQRQNWIIFAETLTTKSRLGETKRISAQQAFVRSYINSCYINQENNFSARGIRQRGVINSEELFCVDAILRVFWNQQFKGINFAAIIKASPPVPATIYSKNSTQLNFIDFSDSDSGVIDFNITTPYENRYSSLLSNEGKKVFASITIVDKLNGVAYTPVILSTIIEIPLPPLTSYPETYVIASYIFFDSDPLAKDVAFEADFESGFDDLFFDIAFTIPDSSANPTPSPGEMIIVFSAMCDIEYWFDSVSSEFEIYVANLADNVGNWTTVGIRYRNAAGQISPWQFGAPTQILDA